MRPFPAFHLKPLDHLLGMPQNEIPHSGWFKGQFLHGWVGRTVQPILKNPESLRGFGMAGGKVLGRFLIGPKYSGFFIVHHFFAVNSIPHLIILALLL